jgi:hypothetical protein
VILFTLLSSVFGLRALCFTDAHLEKTFDDGIFLLLFDTLDSDLLLDEEDIDESLLGGADRFLRVG